MKPPVARKLAVGHMCLTASFLANGSKQYIYMCIFVRATGDFKY